MIKTDLQERLQKLHMVIPHTLQSCNKQATFHSSPKHCLRFAWQTAAVHSEHQSSQYSDWGGKYSSLSQLYRFIILLTLLNYLFTDLEGQFVSCYGQNTNMMETWLLVKVPTPVTHYINYKHFRASVCIKAVFKQQICYWSYFKDGIIH